MRLFGKLLIFFLLLQVNESKAQINFSYTKKLTAPDSLRFIDDGFGTSCAISGNYAIMGAPSYSYDAIGKNKIECGVAFIFEKQQDGNWGFITKLQPPVQDSASMAGDLFGYSVAISTNYVVVGAPYQWYDNQGKNLSEDAGAIYVFERVNGNWQFIKKLTPPSNSNNRNANDHFGYSVAINGNYIVAGAPNHSFDSVGNNLLSQAGAAYIFERKTNGDWQLVKKVTQPSANKSRNKEDQFGSSVSITNRTIIIGAKYHSFNESGTDSVYRAGAAYVYKLQPSGWGFFDKITAPKSNNGRNINDQFGFSTSVNFGYLIISSPRHDYDASGSGKADDAGAAYIFEESGEKFFFKKKITIPPNTGRRSGDLFGVSVSISGNYAAVGASLYEFGNSGPQLSGAGGAFLFYRSNGDWNYTARITPPQINNSRLASDRFGSSVSISGGHTIFGAPNQSYDSIGSGQRNRAGAVYLYGEDNTINDDTLSTFTLQAPSNTTQFDIGGDTTKLPKIIFTWSAPTVKLGFPNPSYTLVFDTINSSTSFASIFTGMSNTYELPFDEARKLYDLKNKNGHLRLKWRIKAEAGNYIQHSNDTFIIEFYDSTAILNPIKDFSLLSPINNTKFDLKVDTITQPKLTFVWEKASAKTGFSLGQINYTITVDTLGGLSPLAAYSTGADTFFTMSYYIANQLFDSYQKNKKLPLIWKVEATVSSYSLVSANQFNLELFKNTLSVDEINGSSIIVFPNPAKNEIYIKADNSVKDIALYSMDGKKILSKNGSGLAIEILNISDVNQGGYILVISQDDNFYTKRIIISH